MGAAPGSRGRKIVNLEQQQQRELKYLDLLRSRHRNDSEVCAAVGARGLFGGVPPPGPETQRSRKARAGAGVWPAVREGRGWPAPEGGGGSRWAPAQTPCDKEKRKIAICPRFAVAFKQRHSEASGGPRPQVPWGYRPERGGPPGGWRKLERAAPSRVGARCTATRAAAGETQRGETRRRPSLSESALTSCPSGAPAVQKHLDTSLPTAP